MGQTETRKEVETAVLVGLVHAGQSQEQLVEYLDELEFLVKTAGAKTVEKFYQKVEHPHPVTYVGKGKLEEIAEYVERKEIDLVIFDDEISPSQQRNIEKVLEVKVLDRAMLILDIFAQRARTVQAKTQVELAQLQYMLPRLRGMWTHLDRIKGGIGMRGAGEKEIETDRRIANQKIAKLKAQLEKIDKQNQQRRKNREARIRVSLVGYTNVGKSTLMKVLSKSDVFAENKLFATLDTTVRKVVLERTPFLLSDTVGFIRKLPHHLVESFKSTLDEVREADVLLHVVDISHPNFEEQMQVVNATLNDLEAGETPTITVFNKMDLFRKKNYDPLTPPETLKEIHDELLKSWMAKTNDQAVFISALAGEGIQEFRAKLLESVKEAYKVRYPYQTQFY